MEYRVWLWGSSSYVVCEDTVSVQTLIASSTGPVRVEVYQLALLRVDTYGLPGGPSIPVPTGQNLENVNVVHAKVK